MSIPIGSATFKRDFVNGNGDIELKVGSSNGPPLSLDQHIPDNVDSILLIGVGSDAAVEIGSSSGLSMKLSFNASARNGISVIRPGASSDFLDDRELGNLLKDEELGIHLFFEAKAGASVAGSLPAGPTGFTFGVQAEGSVGYDRFFVVTKYANAGQIIRQAMSGVRPSSIDGVARPHVPPLAKSLPFGTTVSWK